MKFISTVCTWIFATIVAVLGIAFPIALGTSVLWLFVNVLLVSLDLPKLSWVFYLFAYMTFDFLVDRIMDKFKKAIEDIIDKN